MSDNLPNPAPAPTSQHYLDQQFWDHCAQGVLAFQCCLECGTWRHVPRYMCAHCGSPAWGWRESSGRGTVYSWTVCHMPMSPEFETVFPYAVLVVEMEEELRMAAGLTGLDYRELELGMPMEVEFKPLRSGGKLPFFRPVAR
ncbi:MAG: hypothetical protein CMN28_01220 [Salinisphaeraceae bacterium]|nr:hypothetical protein [Salinisphaeraceae bacterium]